MNESDEYLFFYEKVFLSSRCMSELADRHAYFPVVLSIEFLSFLSRFLEGVIANYTLF